MKRPDTAGALLLAALLAFPSLAFAQQPRTITGHVTAEGASGPPVGVQVEVKGTNLGTLTDAKGDFTVQVPASATTLVFTYIGYKTTEVPITSDHLNVVLKQEAIGLQGLVVTALGIQREKKSLGYSVQQVNGPQVSQVPTPNIINALQGQVAGVHITSANETGGSSRIVIRGASSLMGNNQPVFIIDGIPVDNSDYGSVVSGATSNATPTGQVSDYSGVDWGNALNNLDPNNIQSISVLKGPNAAALYGSRAANGAIVITTKSAAPGENYGITATSSLTFQSPLKLPVYQNMYGQGRFGQFQWVDGFGDGTWDGFDESFGPLMNGQPIDQFTGKQMPFVPQPNNVRDYWKEGSDWETNVAVGRGTTNSNIRLSVTHGNILSMAPGYSIRRNDVMLKGGSKISNRLDVTGEMMYTEETDANRIGTGYNEANPMQGFTWFGRQVDINQLRHYICNASSPTTCVPGQEFNWNYNYHDNPFYMQFVNGSSAQRNRLTGDVDASYQVNDWITLTGKVTRDWYRWYQHQQNDIGTVGAVWVLDGGFENNNIYNNETNYYLTATLTRQLTSSILMNANVGANTHKTDYVNGDVNVYGLAKPSIYNLSNASDFPRAPIITNYETHKEVRSLYGDLSLNYKGWWNVDLTGRNDWSSTLPPGHQSFFYPSISSAFEFTQAMGMNSSLLSSGKIRASWTRVGNDTDPYQLLPYLNAEGLVWQAGVPLYNFPTTLPNPNLRPEQTTAWEVGTDLGFFNERVGFVLTYYHNVTKDQIMPVEVSATSGYGNEILNAGQVTNKGLELQLNATPVRLDNGFRWDMTVNWSKNTSRVDYLAPGLQSLNLGGEWYVDVKAVPGQPYGTLYGYDFARCDAAAISAGSCTSAEKGLPLLYSDGEPQGFDGPKVIGNYNPKWNGGIENRFSYGPWSLDVLFDGQEGGSIFSVTQFFGLQAGVLQASLKGRVNCANPSLTMGCEAGPMVIKGVLPDGTVNGTTETVGINPDTYYYDDAFGANTIGIIDASYLKLRSVRLGYNIPASIMHQIGFSSGTVALIGRNLLLFSHAQNIDPETAYSSGSNVQGIESGQFPSARSYGFSVSIRP